jgi:hypothetical protein
MFEVEIKIKRFNEAGVYYEVAPIGELHDKVNYCYTYPLVITDEEVLSEAKTILNNISNGI